MAGTADRQAEQRVYQIYDALRTALLNKKYYGSRLSTARRYNFWMEMLIAVGATGSGVAGFAVWHIKYGETAWAILSATSVLLAIAKPLLKLTEQIENYAKLYGEYTGAFAKLKMLVDDIQIEREISTSRIKVFEEMRAREIELARLCDPNPSRTLVLKCQNEVNEEIRIDLLWVPSAEPQSLKSLAR